MNEVAWPYKLMQPQEHSRLVENLHWVTQVAGVPIDMMDSSMAELGCSKAEVEWVRHFPSLHQTKNKGGLMLVGREFDPAPEVRLMAMGAAFLRHYIDARVVTIDRLTRILSDEENGYNPTVLIITNFHRVSNTGGAGIPNWQLQQIYGLLVERFSTRRTTIMHVDDEQKLIVDYGKSLHDFIYGNWSIIEAL